MTRFTLLLTQMWLKLHFTVQCFLSRATQSGAPFRIQSEQQSKSRAGEKREKRYRAQPKRVRNEGPTIGRFSRTMIWRDDDYKTMMSFLFVGFPAIFFSLALDMCAGGEEVRTQTHKLAHVYTHWKWKQNYTSLQSPEWILFYSFSVRCTTPPPSFCWSWQQLMPLRNEVDYSASCRHGRAAFVRCFKCLFAVFFIWSGTLVGIGRLCWCASIIRLDVTFLIKLKTVSVKWRKHWWPYTQRTVKYNMF